LSFSATWSRKRRKEPQGAAENGDSISYRQQREEEQFWRKVKAEHDKGGYPFPEKLGQQRQTTRFPGLATFNFVVFFPERIVNIKSAMHFQDSPLA
jgi:hypothetical protein